MCAARSLDSGSASWLMLGSLRIPLLAEATPATSSNVGSNILVMQVTDGEIRRLLTFHQMMKDDEILGPGEGDPQRTPYVRKGEGGYMYHFCARGGSVRATQRATCHMERLLASCLVPSSARPHSPRARPLCPYLAIHNGAKVSSQGPFSSGVNMAPQQLSLPSPWTGLDLSTCL